MTEAQHQANVIKWSQQPSIREKWPELALLHHIPNGGTRDAVEGKHMKQQGVKSGVPDLHLPIARGKYHSLYIELKTETGRASPAQTWWLNHLMEYDNFAVLCHGWKEAVETIEQYLRLGGAENGS